jgi:carboxyl-terminal processing protease
VQTIMPLGNNTAIKLTTARYYTPGGRSIQALGIKPDILVEDPSDTITRVREADLTRHLNNSQAKAEEKKGDAAAPKAKPAPIQPGVVPGETKPVELGSKEDFQLQQAIAHLKGEPVKAVSPTVAQNKSTN